MATVLDRLRDGLRSLRKSPGLTVTILLTVALGIGATTAIFTLDYATLLAPLPYRQPDRLVVVWRTIQGSRDFVSAANFNAWKAQATSFETVTAARETAFNIAGRAEPERVDGLAATAGYWRMLGVGFVLGRDFVPEEGRAGRNHVAIINHEMWERLGANPGILGTAIRIDGQPYTVVGVLAPGIADRQKDDVTLPLVLDSAQFDHDFEWLAVYARLKPGVTIRQAQADMDKIAAGLAELYPRTNQGWGASVQPLKNDFLTHERQSTLWLLMGAGAFVLLIACVNVVNLLLAKGATRERDIVIRSSLGATPRTIFAHLLTEHLLLVTLGGALGVVTGYALLQGLLAIAPPGTIPAEADVRLSVPVLLFTLAATTITGLLVGCAPAWLASRLEPGEVLKEGGRTGRGVGSRRVRRGLVIGEFALALSLLAGAGLAAHSFLNIARADVGARTDHVFMFGVPVPDSRSTDPERVIAYYQRLLASIEAVPGVSSVAVGSGAPLWGPGPNRAVLIAGQPIPSDHSKWPGADFRMVSPDYFSTYGIALKKGRLFNAQDTRSGVKVAVVNERFAELFLKGADPLEHRLVIDWFSPGVTQQVAPMTEWQIVGVVHNVRYHDVLGVWRGLREDEPEVDLPFWQVPWSSADIGVRTTRDPGSMTKSIAAAVHAVDPDIPLASPQTMDQAKSEDMANDRLTLILFASFAVIALLLASIGIYGVMAFSVRQRWREMAIRSALGASRVDVIGLVMKEGAVLAGAGLGMGLAGAYLVGRLMQATLFGVGAIDVPAFSVVGMLLLAAALVACFGPAYQAASAEPLEALRAE
jgi:putative ABC transport system permease protein